MFNYDVNKTYDQQDATLEILIMLAGAFLLGCLLCWLIKKLVQTNKQDILSSEGVTENYDNHQNKIAIPPQSLTNTTIKSQQPITKKNVSNNYSIPKIDDLTKISGINIDIENELRKKGIKSYIDLRDNNKQVILETLKSTHGKTLSTKEAQSWPHQASLAAKGEWEKLKEYQDFISRSKKATKKIKNESNANKVSNKDNGAGADNLKKIEGIGPKIEEILNENGIHTFEALSNLSRDTLKSYLDKAGNRFKMHEPKSWPYQADMAKKGEWEELKIYQEFMDGGRELTSNSSDINPNKELIDNNVETTKDRNEAANQVESDDLTKIKGVTPEIEDILHKKGITTFSKLHETDRDTLKNYLEQAGNQFKMHEPESWPHQAGMAATAQWDELKIYQEFMDSGKEASSEVASLKSNAPQSSKSLFVNDTTTNKVDDLKKIEGIGPKIQDLLNNAGIKTYQDLKNSDRDTIKKLLEAAGPQYRMHEPETWPSQAKLADENEWKKLEEYQEKIINGRTK